MIERMNAKAYLTSDLGKTTYYFKIQLLQNGNKTSLKCTNASFAGSGLRISKSTGEVNLWLLNLKSPEMCS